ncbi:nonsense-mediated mRNA decay factor SMG5 [Pectinophora gossypiella]|uniref:nonsense-mediated mRNA decay factor SMG5 n=1 Tax=Pectinophora gossypiella TaxID=13191 RepID=UPI00214EEAEE|nr:nonsense-mediated mRNA decay factor SMG5 [Pectinophora gossypiella]
MKNGCDETLEAKIAEQGERARKLYRYVNDVARRVGEATVACRSVSDLFSTMLEVQRQKLRDNCEKLIFLDPVNHGKKSLELLWRKVYYDTVTAAKKLQESNLDIYLFTHIVGGIGHFHHLITRIQSEMKVQYKELDYIILPDDEENEVTRTPSENELQFGRSALHSCLIYLGDLSRYQAEIFHMFDASIAARYYLQAAHIDMSSGMPYNQLGNLYLDKNYNLDSVCYYIHCLSCVSPFEGAMGNLTKIFEKNTQFNEASSGPESLTQGEHIQNTVANFLSLIEIWYLSKNDTNIPQRCNVIAQELKIAMDFTMNPLPDINKNYEEYSQAIEEESINPSYLNGNLIHKIVQICLFTIAKLNEIDEQKAFACKAFTLALLSQLLQKLLKQLESLGLKNPAHNYKPRTRSLCESESEKPEEITNGNSSPTANIIPNGNESHEDGNMLAEDQVDEDTKKIANGDAKTAKKVLAKRRRRRRLASSESSDMSDADTESSEVETEETCSDEEDLSESSYQSEEDTKSDGSFYDCSDTEEIKDKVNGAAIENLKEDKKTATNNSNNHENVSATILTGFELNENEIKQFLLGDNILPSIKLLQDWILTEKDLILSCGDSGESLFQCVVDLLNIFTYHFNSKNNEIKDCSILQYVKGLTKKLKLEYKTIPLPEDVNLRGTNICKFDKDAAEWQILDRYKPSVYEENIIRILYFIEFGNQIAKIIPRIRYNRSMKIFFLKKIPVPKLNTKINHKRSREWHNSKKTEGGEAGLLRRLGRLWLAARVRELERCGRAAAAPALLALDAAALHAHLRRVKQLVRTNNFILLVPTVVLQELDDLKRERSTARDAIRWLEIQLKSGSRFLRAQRPGQSKPLPLLKYPRKAPPHVHNFIQILEFCNHFIADEKHTQGGNGDPDNSLQGKSAPLLILLVGDEPGRDEQYKEFSLMGAAHAAGISVEYICDFYTKWRQTLHKSGKKR